jgi:hypothetical protein
MRTSERRTGIWGGSLEQIEATVSSHLGPGRVPGNRQGECFSRQISMYLAKHVGGWSTPQIGRFYNSRHHTTVLYAIQKIERLRERDESVSALLEVLSAELCPTATSIPQSRPRDWSNGFLESLAAEIVRRLTSGETVAGQVRSISVATSESLRASRG